jgi:hypothetical protein
LLYISLYLNIRRKGYIPEVLEGNNLLLAVDRIEVVRTVEVVRTAVDHIAVGHIGVDHKAAVVGGIHLLLP